MTPVPISTLGNPRAPACPVSKLARAERIHAPRLKWDQRVPIRFEHPESVCAHVCDAETVLPRCESLSKKPTSRFVRLNRLVVFIVRLTDSHGSSTVSPLQCSRHAEGQAQTPMYNTSAGFAVQSEAGALYIPEAWNAGSIQETS